VTAQRNFQDPAFIANHQAVIKEIYFRFFKNGTGDVFLERGDPENDIESFEDIDIF